MATCGSFLPLLGCRGFTVDLELPLVLCTFHLLHQQAHPPIVFLTIMLTHFLSLNGSPMAACPQTLVQEVPSTMTLGGDSNQLDLTPPPSYQTTQLLV